MSEATYEDVKHRTAEAIEKVLSFGAPFQLVEHPFIDRLAHTLR